MEINSWALQRMLGVVMVVAAFGLCGCSTVVWETAKKLRETRLTEDQFSDTRIGASLMTELADQSLGLLMDVNVDVWEARVLLTGTVTDAGVRHEVVRRVRADPRIQRVYDELQVVSAAEQARRREAAQNVSSRASDSQPDNDFWVETKISAKLVSAQDVVSVNYRWRSVRNILYVIGRAQSRKELAQVLSLIKDTDGVIRIKSFIVVKPV